MLDRQIYLCSDCGADFPKWSGKCQNCGAWDTIKLASKNLSKPIKSSVTITNWRELSGGKTLKQSSGLNFFDVVLGGGWTKPGLTLLGGDPGVGKSTLALQAAASFVGKVIYVSGEEAISQVVSRLERLLEKTPNITADNLSFIDETNIEQIVSAVENHQPDLLIIDSLQAISSESVKSQAGSLAQVKFCASTLADLAKRLNLAILVIIQVNKAGDLAGPKTVEHLVDIVLHLSGDRYQQYRLLRAVKNRFGSTYETAILAMSADGLQPVKDPSKIFLAGRENRAGSAVFPTVSGSLVFLAEAQALVTKSGFTSPKRSALGFDSKRLELLAAILSKRANLDFSRFDLYVNLTGGLAVKEPAVDLAVAASLISAYFDKKLPDNTAIFGEVGLSGEIRPVPKVKERLKEASRLGFKNLIAPAFTGNVVGLKITKIKEIGELVKLIM